MAVRYSIARSTQLFSSCAGAYRTTALRRAQPSFVRSQYAQKQFSGSAIRAVKAYTEDHEWVELSDDKKTCTVGISKYAANALGDVTYVELPEMDLEVGTGDPIGAVESVKSASDVFSPLEGKVVGINSILEEKPSLLNKDAEGEGWVCKISVANPDQFDGLMDADAYKKFTEESSS